MEIQNRKIPEGEFMAMRQEVLQQWPTGRDVDLTEAAAYQKQQKPSRNFSARLIEAKKEHRTLIQPRAGVPVLEEHIKLMQYLEKEGEADLLPTTIDSYTRQNRYHEAEEGIKASRKRAAPCSTASAVNHGVYGCRRIVGERSTCRPRVRHGTRMRGFDRDRLRGRLHQLRGRRHLLQSALLQKRPDGDDHRQLAVRRPVDRPV